MKKAATLLYLLFIILALVATIFFINRDYTSIVADNRSSNELNYLKHQSEIEELFEDNIFEDDREFQRRLNGISDQDIALQGLILLIPGEAVFYNHLNSSNKNLLERFGRDDLDIGPDSDLHTYQSQFYEIYNLPIRTGLEKNIQCYFIYKIYKNNDILRHLKYALYVVAFLFILTLVLLVISLRSGNGTEGDENYEEDPLLGSLTAEDNTYDTPSDFDRSSDLDEQYDDSDYSFDESSDLNDDFDKLDSPTSVLDEQMEPSSDFDSEGSIDFDLPDENMDFSMPTDDSAEESMDFDLSEGDSLDDLDFQLPEESPSEESIESDELDDSAMDESMNFDLPSDSEMEESLDFDLPSETEESLDFDLPDDSALEDFDLPEDDALSEATEMDMPTEPSSDEESNLDLSTVDSLEDMDFDLPGDETLEQLDFDIPGDDSQNEATELDIPVEDSPKDETENQFSEEDNLEDMDFDLPEDDTLEEMELELPEDDSLSNETETIAFAEESSTEKDDQSESEEVGLDEMGFDLPGDEELEDMDFDLPEENALAESTDENIPTDELLGEEGESVISEEDSLDDLDFDLPEDDTLDEMDFELPGEEVSEERVDSNENELDDNLENFDTSENLNTSETGLSNEDFLMEKLENELDRSANEDENLLLTYIKYPDADEGKFKDLTDSLIDQFGDNDLNFQWGDQGIAIIKQNSSLENWLMTLDEINQNWNGDLRIGVSSRNNRIVETEQLMIEAQHAQERTNPQKPVIGFQADPEKFRLALSNED